MGRCMEGGDIRLEKQIITNYSSKSLQISTILPMFFWYLTFYYDSVIFSTLIPLLLINKVEGACQKKLNIIQVLLDSILS